MENLFILNSSANILDIKDGISERLSKARAIVNCLRAETSFEQNELISNPEGVSILLWTIDTLLVELEKLQDLLEERVNN